MQSVESKYYDGQSARQLAVTLVIANGELELSGENLQYSVPLAQVNISSRLGSAPRMLHFSDGGHCEVTDHMSFEAMLREAGMQPYSLLAHMESHWRHALGSTVLVLAIVVASFYWGLPWAASIAAKQIPSQVSLAIDEHFMKAVDQGLMNTSTLSETQQAKLSGKFSKLIQADNPVEYQLIFRSSKRIGANAFALPGGTILVTDQLVALAGNDEEVLAVLAHELGHVSEKHPMRQLLQSSVVGLVMTWYLGDISTLLAAAPTLLLESSYSRKLERSADLYAAAMLSANNIPPSRMADILEKMEKSHSGSKVEQKSSSRISELFSSHPDTSERIRVMRNYVAE